MRRMPIILSMATADLGELVTETLVLALDPYPRKPGAAFEGAEFGTEIAAASFADLAVLRKPAATQAIVSRRLLSPRRADASVSPRPNNG